MTRLEIQTKIKMLREELESRHRYGSIKIANEDGTPVSVEKIQNELYRLIYKLSKFE